MSTTYDGGKTASIASSTDTTPIAITTTAPHGFATADIVQIVGHFVNTNANGEWGITVTGASTFELQSSTATGSGAGVATGTAHVDAYDTSATIPSDGDDLDASAFNVAYEELLDRTQWLKTRRGIYRLVEIQEVVGTGTSPAASFVTNAYAGFAGIVVGMTVAFLDMVEVSFCGHLRAVTDGNVQLAYTANGGSAVGFGAGARSYWTNPPGLGSAFAAATFPMYPFTMESHLAGISGAITFGIWGKLDVAVDQIDVYQPYSMIVKRWTAQV